MKTHIKQKNYYKSADLCLFPICAASKKSTSKIEIITGIVIKQMTTLFNPFKILFFLVKFIIFLPHNLQKIKHLPLLPRMPYLEIL